MLRPVNLGIIWSGGPKLPLGVSELFHKVFGEGTSLGPAWMEKFLQPFREWLMTLGSKGSANEQRSSEKCTLPLTGVPHLRKPSRCKP